MTRQIEIVGKSGNRYRYTSLEEDRILPPAGANYIIAKPGSQGVDILYVGETDSLARTVWRDQLARAKDVYGSEVDVLTRLNVRSAVRHAEREDLIEEYQPPMNAQAHS